MIKTLFAFILCGLTSGFALADVGDFDFEGEVTCYSESRRGYVSTFSDVAPTYRGAETHDINCETDSGQLKCLLPNSDTIQISSNNYKGLVPSDEFVKYRFVYSDEYIQEEWVCWNRGK